MYSEWVTYVDSPHELALIMTLTCQGERLKVTQVTLRALRRACSSSRAACFSRSSTLVKDMPVLAREDTALDRVLALADTERKRHTHTHTHSGRERKRVWDSSHGYPHCLINVVQ